MKMYKLIIAILFFSVLQTAYPHAGGHHHKQKDYKEWTLENGTTFKGVFSLVKNGKVYLETPDYQLVSYDIATLSDVDRQYVEKKIIEINAINASLNHGYNHKEHEHSVQNAIINDTTSNSDSNLIFWVIGIISLSFMLTIIIKRLLTKNLSSLDTTFLVITGLISVTTVISCKKKGCTDPTASNYSSKAKKDDGSCQYDFTYSSTPLPNNVSDMTAAFAPYTPHVSTSNDGTTFFVEADAIANHEMMKGITAWIDQFPVYQKMTGSNSWQIPIAPSYSTAGYTITDHFRKYAIGVAANGIAIFNPYNASNLISADIGELDEFGGHAGTGDDYHYHAAPTHLDNGTTPTIVAYALDGFPVYGALEPDGTAMQDLDPVYHGHEINGSFHYHATDSYPFMVNAFRGEITIDHISAAPNDQITPQPATQNFRGNPYPLSGGATSTLIDSCIANGLNNGYTLYYTVDGLNKKVEYHWTAGATDSIYFNFYNDQGGIEHSEVWTR